MVAIILSLYASPLLKPRDIWLHRTSYTQCQLQNSISQGKTKAYQVVHGDLACECLCVFGCMIVCVCECMHPCRRVGGLADEDREGTRAALSLLTHCLWYTVFVISPNLKETRIDQMISHPLL